jgi:hypothetical protein
MERKPMTYDQFVVTTNYCNQVETNAPYDNPHEAIANYTDRLSEAFEPTEREPATLNHPEGEEFDRTTPVPNPHVLRTRMQLVNTEDHIIHTIDSGVFACEHTSGTPVSE